MPPATITRSDPAVPPTQPRDAGETELLLAFVRDRDVPCPRCQYNLRNLTQPVCPECREELRLAVGNRRMAVHWLIAALAPGIFSTISAFFMTSMLIVVNLSPTGRAPWQPYALSALGWLSAIFAAGLFVRRYKFLKQPDGVQIGFAAAIWMAHISVFVIMWSLMQ